MLLGSGSQTMRRDALVRHFSFLGASQNIWIRLHDGMELNFNHNFVSFFAKKISLN